MNKLGCNLNWTL